MNKLIEGDELVQMNLKNDGHSKNHPFLRILYNYKGYYQFWCFHDYFHWL